MREIKVYRAKKKRIIITGVAFVFRHLLRCASFNYPARMLPEGSGDEFGNVLESDDIRSKSWIIVIVTGMLVFMLWMQVWPSKIEELPA